MQSDAVQCFPLLPHSYFCHMETKKEVDDKEPGVSNWKIFLIFFLFPQLSALQIGNSCALIITISKFEMCHTLTCVNKATELLDKSYPRPVNTKLLFVHIQNKSTRCHTYYKRSLKFKGQRFTL